MDQCVGMLGLCRFGLLGLLSMRNETLSKHSVNLDHYHIQFTVNFKKRWKGVLKQGFTHI